MTENNEENVERERLYKKVIDWIENNHAQFGKCGQEFYDPDNLERIRRFAKAPMEYIDERIELNKEVSKGYHKLHTTILLAGFTGIYSSLIVYSFTQAIMIHFFKYDLFFIIS